MTWNPAFANSTARGRPTYPSPITPTTAERSLIRSSNRCFVDESAAMERSDGIDDLVELRVSQLRVDGKRQHLLRRLLGFGALPFFVAEVGETRLEVQRKRIVDRRTDAALFEECLQLVTPLDANGVLVEDRFVRRFDIRRHDVVQLGEGRVVILGVFAPLRAPRGEMRQLGTEDRGLERVEAAVEADFVVEIHLGAAVHA